MAERLTDHNVVATFPDAAAARKAILALGRAGIESGNVSFLGRDIEEVSSDPDTRLRDLDVTGEVAKKAAAGAATGGVLGALAGAAAFVVPGVGPVVGAGIFGAMAAGAIGGGAVGGMVGGVGSIDLTEDWEVLYGEDLRGGKVVIAVHAEDESGAEKARKLLEGESPEKVETVGADGQPARAQ